MRSVAGNKVSCPILLKMGNILAVRYINCLRRTKFKVLADWARYFWQYCLDHKLSVMVYICQGSLTRQRTGNPDTKRITMPGSWTPLFFRA